MSQPADEREARRATILAPAKVNLALHVRGRRPDGYHEIDTLFQAIDLCDEVEVVLGGEGVALDVRGADLGPAEENLAYRAAAGFLAEAGVDVGVRVRLVKRIPHGAGLGGGSSDAAAVLRCLVELIGGVDSSRLATLGARLGSDVPFFLGESPLARGRGRGEVLESLPPLPAADLVCVSPPVHVSTAEAYAALSARRAGGTSTAEPLGVLESWQGLEAVARNDFEGVMAEAHAEISRALDALRAAASSVVSMTGSGSTCFGLFGSPSDARLAAEDLTVELGWPCLAVRTLEALPGARRG